MCPGFSSPTQKIVILVITVFGENSGIQALPDVQRAMPAKKKAKISQNLKVSGTSHTAGGQHKDTAGSLRAIWVSNCSNNYNDPVTGP